MDTKKILSSLSYFSLFFAGFVFPLIVFLVSDDQEVKGHAKKALFSHLIPLILVPFIIFGALMDVSNGSEFPMLFIIMIIIFSIISFIIAIWNIVKGIKVLL